MVLIVAFGSPHCCSCCSCWSLLNMFRPARIVDLWNHDAVGVLQHDLCSLYGLDPAISPRFVGAVPRLPLLLLLLPVWLPRAGAGVHVFLPDDSDGECIHVILSSFCIVFLFAADLL